LRLQTALIGDIPSEEFLDEIVEESRHLFVPASDGAGYLIWGVGEK
jgi:hypothetical protein